MSQPDFDKNIGKALKGREIDPSKESWARLQGRLDYEKKEGIFKLWWLFAAAAVIAGVVLFAPLDAEPVKSSPAFVVQPQQKVEKSSEETSQKMLPVVRDHQQKSEAVADYIAVPEVETKEKAFVKKEEAPALAISEIDSGGSKAAPEETLGLSRSDAEEAIAEVTKEIGIGMEVTDAEIDALLAAAMSEVQQEQSLVKSTPVAAEDLLLEVETELEHSFRQKVLEVLKEGYRKTKTAVANSID